MKPPPEKGTGPTLAGVEPGRRQQSSSDAHNSAACSDLQIGARDHAEAHAYEEGRPVPRPTAEQLDDDPWTVVVVEHDEDAASLADAYQGTAVQVVAVADRMLADLVRGRVVLACDRATRHAGDLAVIGAAQVWELLTPPPFRSLAEYAEDCIRRAGAQTPGELLELVRAVTGRARLVGAGDVPPTGHPAFAAAAVGGDAGAEATEEAKKPSPIETGWAAMPVDVFRSLPPPRRWLLRHPTKDGAPCPPGEGDGLLVRGKAGLIIAEGGAGKTLAIMGLAVSLVTGRPWLNHYPATSEGGRVLMLLGEEDAEEVHRRMWAIGRALKLTDSEQAAAGREIVCIPLAGKVTPLCEKNAAGIGHTRHYSTLLYQLAADAGPDGWSLIVVDPLSRFAGVQMDLDNYVATRVVQSLESLCDAPGRPTVLALHHSSKDARKNGSVDARGATSLTDSVRWVGGLTVQQGGNVEFRQTKSNYSRPMPLALELARGPEGVLQAIGEVTRDAASRQQAERDLADRAALLQSLSVVGQATKVDAIVVGSGVGVGRGRALVRRLIDEGAIVDKGTHKRPLYVLANVSEEGGGENPPYPPVDESSSTVAGGDGSDDRRRATTGRRGSSQSPTERPTARTIDEGQPEQPRGRRRRKAGGAA